MLKMVQQLEREIFSALGRKQKRTGTFQVQENAVWVCYFFVLLEIFFVLVKILNIKLTTP